MKIGVISDIHGNIKALNAVLDEFKKKNIEQMICCGDIIGIGPRSEETVQKVMEYKDKLIAVRGNHEQYLLKGIPDMLHGRPMRDEERKFHQWTHGRLSEESKQFLESFPCEQFIEINNKKIYITHYAYDENKKFKKHILEPTLEEADELFSEINADIILFGHTHKKIFNKSKTKWYINPGPLGCPGTTNNAYFGILDIEESNIKYENLSVEYDANSVINEIEELKYPYYKIVLGVFFGNMPVD